jgi:hypothetical protein
MATGISGRRCSVARHYGGSGGRVSERSLVIFDKFYISNNATKVKKFAYFVQQ